MPCSPGMTACKATCMHRAHVEGYRAERSRQQDELYERAKGYSTEIHDLETQARENSPHRTPYITFQQWLVQSAIPQEVRDMPEPVQQDGARFLRFDNDVQANEAYLLATALVSDRGVEALRVVGPGEFAYPEHQNIGRAILDLAFTGRPHDAEAVTEELRNRPLLDMLPPPNEHRQKQEDFLLSAMSGDGELGVLMRMDLERFDPDLQPVAQAVRTLTSLDLPADRFNVQAHLDREGVDGSVYRMPVYRDTSAQPPSQLPRHMDPLLVTGRTIDHTEYGLGAWQTHAPPPVMAPHFAQNVRSAHRQRYLVDGLERMTQMAKGSLTWDHTGAVDQDLLGMVREQAAYHLMDMPPMLDHNLNPVTSPDRDQSVETWKPRVTSSRTSAAIADPTKDLNLPPLMPPELSQAGQAVIRAGRH